MKLNGIEYYDAIDFTGGVNTISSKYLNWGATTYTSTPYANGRVYLNEMLLDLTLAPSKFCINFKYSFTPYNSSKFYIIDVFNKGTNRYPMGNIYYYPGSQRDREYNKFSAYERYNTNSNGVNYSIFPYPTSVHMYNLTFDSNVWNLYIDDILYSTFTNSYKWIWIGFQDWGNGYWELANTANELWWLSVTDLPAMIIPKPVNTLEEKDNDMYGILKE